MNLTELNRTDTELNRTVGRLVGRKLRRSESGRPLDSGTKARNLDGAIQRKHSRITGKSVADPCRGSPELLDEGKKPEGGYTAVVTARP